MILFLQIICYLLIGWCVGQEGDRLGWSFPRSLATALAISFTLSFVCALIR